MYYSIHNTKFQVLKKIISKIDFGIKWNGHPIHCNSNKSTIEFYIRKKKWLPSLTYEKYHNHCEGIETYYFTGTESGESLAMIDIDCHKCGTLDGAKKFAEYLKINFFPDLRYEPSTNGNGIHGYFVHNTDNATLLLLGKTLNQHLQELNFDVELVEIKGLRPTIQSEKGRFQNYTGGTLGRNPILDMSVYKIQNIPNILKKLPLLAKKNHSKNPCCSCTDRLIDFDRLPDVKKMIENCGYETLIGAGRHIATAEDVAITILILEFITKHMNQDGSLPTARVEALWDACFNSGDINRTYNHSKFKVIRDWLSKNGLLSWDNPEYCIGQACKWKLSQVFMVILDKEEDLSLTPQDTVIIPIKKQLSLNMTEQDQFFLSKYQENNKLKKEREKLILIMMRKAA
jgi:hypothetical protein